jgi:chemotaxis protein CheZ
MVATHAFEMPPENEASVAALDNKAVVRELAAIADYIKHLKGEIGTLKANELYRDRIPMAHEELGSVVQATASATNIIMGAAEEILCSNDDVLDRAQVQAKLLQIFEACAFQDITGQRISKVLEALSQLENRLGRFASAVNARDSAEGPDQEEALRQARREALILNGPQIEGRGVGQTDIDEMFP